MRRLALSTILMLAACGGGDPPIRSTAPDAPAANDESFTFKGFRTWSIVGDGVTMDSGEVKLQVTTPEAVGFVDAWIVAADGTTTAVRLDPTDKENTWIAKLDATQFAPGEYSVILAADGGDAFAKRTFQRSYPYYVLVSTDWDFADPGAFALGAHTQLHEDHPGIKITHFAAPYTFTDPAVTEARRMEISTWLLDMQSKYGDEIGLHIHPYCHFVTDAQVTCITDQSTVYATDTSGYTIKLGAYSHADFGKLLDHAKDLFAAHGLPAPKTFRAGGWTATADTLSVLSEHGYVADTSALNWRTIEEWEHQGTHELWNWNMMNWSTIGDTSQPYHPSATDAQAPGTLAMLEVPDNGTMIDYVSVAELTMISDANFMGTALAKPTTLMMGFHPSVSFSQAELNRVDGFLDYSDMHLASKDTGPVVYANLEQMAAVFPLK